MANKWGAGFPNTDIDPTELDRFLSLGVDNTVLLHHQGAYLPALRERLRGTPLLRYYATRVLETTPVEYAQQVAAEAVKLKATTADWVFCNELNLSYEGGRNCEDPHYAAEWVGQTADHLLKWFPSLRLHAPAFAPVGNWWQYHEALLPYLDRFDVVGIHAYGTFEEMKAVVEAVKSTTDKPLFISECNGPGTMELFRWIEGEPQIEGAAYFIFRWQSPDPGWKLDLLGSPLEDEIRQATKTDFGGEGMGFEYIQGFKVFHDAHPEIGNPTSDLMYDANGNALQYTEQGKLEWNKSSNQVQFYAAGAPKKA